MQKLAMWATMLPAPMLVAILLLSMATGQLYTMLYTSHIMDLLLLLLQ